MACRIWPSHLEFDTCGQIFWILKTKCWTYSFIWPAAFYLNFFIMSPTNRGRESGRKTGEKEEGGKREEKKRRGGPGERGRENLPSITSIHGKNEERKRLWEREGGRPSSFIQCQGLDSPPVIRLFHCAERSGRRGERRGVRGRWGGTGAKDRI